MSEKPGRKKGLINENSRSQNTLLNKSAQLAKIFGKYWKKGLTGCP